MVEVDLSSQSPQDRILYHVYKRVIELTKLKILKQDQVHLTPAKMSEDYSQETIGVIKFKWKEEEWHERALKTKAMGLIKGWWSELEAEEELDLKSSDIEMKERIVRKFVIDQFCCC